MPLGKDHDVLVEDPAAFMMLTHTVERQGSFPNQKVFVVTVKLVIGVVTAMHTQGQSMSVFEE